MEIYSMHESDIQSSANTVKEVVLKYLERNDLLKDGHNAEEIGQSMAVIIYRKGLLGQWIDKLFNTDPQEKGFRYMVAKIE